jgi:hypothetical protein
MICKDGTGSFYGVGAGMLHDTLDKKRRDADKDTKFYETDLGD